MKILTKEQLYQADSRTLESEGISSLQLMERAATLAFEWLHERLKGNPVPLQIFCGVGNNGGDGLVMARHLVEHGYTVAVYIVDYTSSRSEDFLSNLQALKERKIWPETFEKGGELPQLKPDGIIVDAVFGIGLSRPPEPWLCKLFDHINASGAFVLSVDLPSGMFAEPAPEGTACMVRARHVLTFGSPKLSFFLPETGPAVPEWTVLDIGLDRIYLQEVETPFELWGWEQARGVYKRRQKFSHKGTYGHVCVVGGAYGSIGAVQLASRAALKAGAGLVTSWVPQCGMVPLQSSLPEVMVRVSSGSKWLRDFPEAPSYTFAAGMGMGTGQETAGPFLEWVARQERPLLLDADALNVLAGSPEKLASLPKDSVLTPHPGEFERLAGAWSSDAEKLEKAGQFSREYRCVLVLKGAHTVVFADGKAWINTTGNPGMATAGSGDVLSGLIAGLLAQGYAPVDAARLGVYLHGRTADLLLAKTSQEGLTSGMLAGNLDLAFRDLFYRKNDVPAED